MKPNTPGFIGERLKEAREARGLNGTALADLLGISRQSISKYENGQQSPSPEIMDEICRILRLPVEFFLYGRKRATDSTSPIFYRSMSAATKFERLKAERRYIWLQDIFSYLWQFVEFPDANLPSFDLPDDPLQISDAMIEEVAVKTRKFWNLGEGPISNIVWLLENHGIIVGCYSLEAPTLDAFSQFCYDRPHVIIGTDKLSVARSRFNAAHELGHLILHRHIPSKYLKMPAYFKAIENQANRFSGAFHFTRSAFLEEASLFDLDFFKVLKRKWKISIAAMIHRARDLELIDEHEAQLLWRSYMRKKWKEQEPLDDEIPAEQPQLLKNAFELIIEQGIQSRLDVLHKLKLDPLDIEEISGLEPGFLSEKKAEVIQLPIRPSFRTSQSSDTKGQVIYLPIGKID